MLGLPQNTEVYKLLPKTKIFRFVDNKTISQSGFDNDISKIYFVNEISPLSMGIADGSEIKAIYVLLVNLKKQDYNPKNIIALNKIIGSKFLIVLKYGNQIQLAISYDKLVVSKWFPEDGFRLKISALNLDDLWKEIVIQVGDIKIAEGRTLEEQIQLDEQKLKTLKKIEALESKMTKEPQPYRKRQYFEEIQKLRRSICG